MAWYFSKEKLNSKKAGPATKRYTERWNDAILVVKSMIHSKKDTDVAHLRHGRWIPFHSTAAGDIQYCSACEIGCTWKPDYCPNCGAKMDFGVMTMKFCYYVIWNETKDVTGPMPLKEALKFKEEHEWIQPMSILKLVIDEDGKEVK